jgi:hypothetical protein
MRRGLPPPAPAPSLRCGPLGIGMHIRPRPQRICPWLAGNSRAHTVRVASSQGRRHAADASGRIERRPIGRRAARFRTVTVAGNWQGRNSLAKKYGWDWHPGRPKMRRLPDIPAGIADARGCLPRATPASVAASRLPPTRARPAVSAGDRTLAGYPFGLGPDMVIRWWRHRDAHWRKKPALQRHRRDPVGNRLHHRRDYQVHRGRMGGRARGRATCPEGASHPPPL